MSLREIEKDIQKHESEIIKREHDTTAYDVWRSQEKIQEDVGSDNWQKIKDRLVGVRIRGIVLGGIILFGITIIVSSVVSFVYFQKGFFAQERVALSIETSQAINSNKLTEVTFVYDNDNRATLSNAEIAVGFGDHFVPAGEQDNFTQVSDSQGVIRIGKIGGHDKGKFVLTGYFAGPQNSINTISGILRYTPEKTNVRYETNARAVTTITSSPVIIDVESPLSVVSGNLMNIVFKIKNTSDTDLSQLKFSVEMPDTFSLYNSSPLPNYGNTWLLDGIKAKSEIAVVIRGGIGAAVGTRQSFTGRVFSQNSTNDIVEYANVTYTPNMIQSPITVQQKLVGNSDVVYPSERLSYIVTFINNSDVPLRDAIVTVNLDSAVLDYEKLELLDGGDYDQENRRIVWKAADVPALKIFEPQKMGEVRFIVPVLENLPVNNDQDYHFSTSSIASIDSEDIPSELRENKTVLSNILTVPVGAKVLYEPKIAFKSGAKKLKVGEETIYTVTIKMGSVNNDLDNVKVFLPLPTHTKYEGNADNDGMEYNERSNELVWDIGKMTHGTGITSDAREISFDLSIKPSIDQLGAYVPIIKSQKIAGVDTFTQKNFEFSRDVLTTAHSDQDFTEKTVQP